MVNYMFQHMQKGLFLWAFIVTALVFTACHTTQKAVVTTPAPAQVVQQADTTALPPFPAEALSHRIVSRTCLPRLYPESGADGGDVDLCQCTDRLDLQFDG